MLMNWHYSYLLPQDFGYVTNATNDTQTTRIRDRRSELRASSHVHPETTNKKLSAHVQLWFAE
jgi:hypothetical protein